MLGLLVLRTVGALCWMLAPVRVPWVMYWVLLPPVSPLAPSVIVGDGVVGGVRVWVLLVALLLWVLQSLVLGVGLGVVGRWVLLGAGPCHSWLRAWCVALLVGYSSVLVVFLAALHLSWRSARGAGSRCSFVVFVVGVGGGFLASPG